MAENLKMKPTKSILKSPSSFEAIETNKSASTDLKWDEMNILQTLHPPEKDYGHMKIDEPKTPYSYYDDKNDKEMSEHGNDQLDAKKLAEKMEEYDSEKDKPAALNSPDEEDDEDLTEEEKAQKSAFEYKRKMHYNEFYAVKLARKLINKDDDEDEDEGEDETKDESKEENKEEKDAK